jgi:hypothetical protein
LFAKIFHFQPSELWKFGASDFKFWSKRLDELSDLQQKGMK